MIINIIRTFKLFSIINNTKLLLEKELLMKDLYMILSYCFHIDYQPRAFSRS